MVKKLLIGLLALGVIAGAAVFFVLGNLGEIIKGVVEKVGSQATATPVTLEQVDISLTEGNGELKNLIVGNPEAFETEHAMALGLIRLDIDPSTVGSNPVVINEIVIEAPQIIYEVSGGGTNIGTIQENVAAFAAGLPKGEGGTSEEPAPEEQPAGEGTKVVISNLYVRNARAAVSASFLGGKDVGVTIPEIHLADIGKGEGGASAGQVAAQILDAISEAVIDSVAKENIDGLKDALEKEKQGLLDKVGGFFGGDDDEDDGKKKKRKKK